MVYLYLELDHDHFGSISVVWFDTGSFYSKSVEEVVWNVPDIVDNAFFIEFCDVYLKCLYVFTIDALASLSNNVLIVHTSLLEF